MTNVLAVGSHPDDLDMGCGGTLLRHSARGDTVVMLVVTQGQAGPGKVSERVKEQRSAAAIFGADLVLGDLPDGSVSNHELALVRLIESVCEKYSIDTVYTHAAADSHQDHRAVALASLGACRAIPRLLAYDSPSSFEFNPAVYVDISDSMEKKIHALRCHASQVANSNMVSEEMIRGQAAYRGHHARVEFAEGFMPLRMVLDL